MNKTRTWTDYKEKELDRIELVSRVEALIPDNVIVTRNRSLDTGYRDLDDATSREGR